MERWCQEEEAGGNVRGMWEELSEGTDESIKCFCESEQEQGEMVCCEVCSGGFHLKCMGMKEGTNLLKGKVFICHLCFFLSC